MSLETALEKNTEALMALLAEMQEQRAERKDIIANLPHLAAGVEPAKKPRGRPAKVADQAEESAAVDPVPAPLDQTKPRDQALADATAHVAAATLENPSIEELRNAAQAFLDTSDADVKKQRRGAMASILDFLGISANDEGKRPITLVDEDDRERVIGWFKEYLANGQINFRAADPIPAAADDDDDDIG